MINLPPAEIDDAAFANCCESLPLNVKEQIASTYPFYFTAALVFPGGPGGEAPPPKPGPVKAREPKATPAIDKERVACEVLANLLRHPGVRSEDITVPSLSGVDAKTANRIVRAILEKAADAKEVFFEGAGRGRRYKVAVKATEPEAAE